MKKFFIFFLFVTACCRPIQAQQVLADFEDDTSGNLTINTASYTASLFTNVPSVCDNPDRTGINTSEKCFGATNIADADWYGNYVELKLKEPVTIGSSNRLLSFLAYRSIQPKEFRIGFNNFEEASQLYLDKLPADSSWERVVIDLGSGFMGKTLESIWIVYSCNWNNPRSGWGEAEYYFDDFTLSGSQLHTAQIVIDPSIVYQTIDDFGASDCWTVDYIGKYWSKAQTDGAAEKLFSKEFDANGNPKGIGLSNWRVNLGAGSAEQGAESGIEDAARRGECFLKSDGTYDWSKQSGQQYFMQKAKEYGCENFLLFSNSPPVQFTRNGKAFANSGETGCNLKSDCFDDFAEFLATVSEHFIDEGYNITYISPVNEPQYSWTSGQEGSPWQNGNIRNLVTELDKSIRARELPVKIMIPESGDWNYLRGGSGRATNQIEAFFNPSNSSTWIGDLPSVAPLAAGHSYWTFGSNSQLKSARTAAWEKAKQYGLKLYQTEWSMLDAPPSTETGFPASYDAASYMDIALFMGKLIYCDLAFANVSSWSYWTAFSTEVYSQKNRFFLMRLRPNGGDYAPLTSGGTIVQNANLWALGNYSRFIRPGYKRIRLDGAAEMNHLLGTAYASPDGSQIVTVYVNTAMSEREIDVRFRQLVGKAAKIRKYVTRGTSNLQRDRNLPEAYTGARITVPARSLATIVYDIEDDNNSIIDNSPASRTLTVYPNPVRNGGKITVVLPDTKEDSGKIDIGLYSPDGRLLYEETVSCNGNRAEFRAPNSIQGICLLRIDCGGKRYYQKIVVNP